MSLEKYIKAKKTFVNQNQNTSWYNADNSVSRKQLDQHLLILAEEILEDINKPVETTNEQPTHLVMMYNYPTEFINLKKISKQEYCKGFDSEERECTKFIPIKLGKVR